MSAQATIPVQPVSKRYLFNGVVDFLCLGGASLIILPLIALMPVEASVWIGGTALLLSNFINHPHFAHSYQIFYTDFRRKIKGDSYPRKLQYLYIFSGIIVPILLVSFFGWCLMRGDARLLGYGVNAMLLTVGWHYAKQGFGIMIVDSVYKKLFLSPAEKKIFLINTHVNWIFFWLYTNAFLFEEGKKYWDIQYYAIPVPLPIVYGFGIAAGLSTVLTLFTLVRYGMKHKTIPLNGLTAYFTSIYIWLWLRYAPLALLFVPFFHSLQYLIVVWRYELNAQEKAAISGKRIAAEFKKFLILGVILGFLGFWGIPIALSQYVSYDRAIFGSALFLFISWIFINVHHYFLDTVIWRRENPNTKKYLFG